MCSADPFDNVKIVKVGRKPLDKKNKRTLRVEVKLNRMEEVMCEDLKEVHKVTGKSTAKLIRLLIGRSFDENLQAIKGIHAVRREQILEKQYA